MPQSLVQNYQHIVFSTKNRAAFLSDSGIRQEMHAYLGGACRDSDSPSLAVGGVADHVHILCRLSKHLAIVNFIRDIKRESSKWIKTKDSTYQAFQWQNGYGAFSVSPSHVPDLIRYIGEQEAHHHRESFQDEFRRLLKKYGLEWDERYVWD
ncbi:transposase [Candidatus Sumerlaeota bacterium]|nr:transposase [Candidatus Sumerlaeota bacterium]